jgi:4,5:9,10-diseco-3-hydroxy-5,9,17-trioxoandrosta-1(10),2-diene-4-oate hydrolase
MHVAVEPSGVATQRGPSSPAPAGPRGADADRVTARSAIGAVAPRYFTVDGVVLAFDDEGSGPPVVCLHAIGHGARDFERLRARLRDRHRVIALDWPGQGRSGGDHRPASAGRYAELLDAFLTAAGIERPILVGNSIGGAVAIRYAHAWPAAVRALVLENPGGLAPTTDLAARLALAAMARFFGAGARGARWFPAAFALYYRSVLQRPAARAQRRRIVAAAYDLAPVLAQAWGSFAAPEADLRALAPAVTCPVLFAWAARDQVVSLRRSLPAIRQFPDARIERFPAGHAPHLETPEAFEASIERFLAPFCR